MQQLFNSVGKHILSFTIKNNMHSDSFIQPYLGQILKSAIVPSHWVVEYKDTTNCSIN